jgi:probable rRNA maturation factor
VSKRATVIRQKASVLRCPTGARMQPWVEAALDAANHRQSVALTIRFVDEEEGLSLNQQYRHKKYATNVLSFSYDAPELPEDMASVDEPVYLGDLVICMPVVLNEAASQNKIPATHTAHLVVHGVLHLLGYDHEATAEAEQMEQIEVDAMQKLGFENPYSAD